MKLDSISKAYMTMLTEEFTILSEDMLMEDRIEYLKKNIKAIDTSHDPHALHKSTEAIIDHFANTADPSKNKVHTQFLLGLYKNKSIRQEDSPRIKEALTNFDKYKSKLSSDDRQLNIKRFPTLASLEDKVAPHIGKETVSKSQAGKDLEQPGHELQYEDDKIKVFKLSSKEASQNLYGGGHNRGGLGTSWCTAARSDNCMYDHYSKDSPLYVVHRKSDGEPFQYHVSSGQFMNRKDDTISDEEFSSIKDSLHKAWDAKPELLKSTT
jgi:hypothetical protein